MKKSILLSLVASYFGVLAQDINYIPIGGNTATGGGVTNNATGLTPIMLSALIQPGGIVVMGDSLDTWFAGGGNVNNIFGTNAAGGVKCGGTTNIVTAGQGLYTNGMTFLYAENQGFTNENWLIDMTNFVKQTVGWTVPLDTALAVSGQGYMVYGDPDLSLSYWQGQQVWVNNNAYNASGTNTVYAMGGMTNKIVFWGTNDYGVTNDLYLVCQGSVYSNPAPGLTFTTNIFVTGSYGATIACQAVGVPSTLMSISDYPTHVAGGYGLSATYRLYFPPYYNNSLTNDPLIYLTNISPVVTGIPKALFLPSSQNDRFFASVSKGTNNSPPRGAFWNAYTNAYAQGLQLAHLAQIGHALGFWPVIGATIPDAPSSSGTNAMTMNQQAILTNSVFTNFDGFYDWHATNYWFYTNSSLYVSDPHASAFLARIEATNMATAFKVQKSASIK